MPTLSARAAQRLVVDRSVVELVEQSLEYKNIRHLFLSDADGAPESLSAELRVVAVNYCGAPNTHKSAFIECMDFVVKSYGHLTLGEIREAFRLAAAGELSEPDTDTGIPAKPVSLKAYYGLFTVAMLGEVLEAYGRYRTRIVAEIRKAQNDQYFAEKAAPDTEIWIANRTVQLLSMSEFDPELIYIIDYDTLLKKGTINPTADEKNAAWEKAKLLTTRMIAQEKNAEKHEFNKIALGKILKDTSDETFKSRRTRIAKGLIVYDWIEKTRFYDHGLTSPKTIQTICDKIVFEQPLTEFEQAVFTANTDQINTMLVNYQSNQVVVTPE